LEELLLEKTCNIFGIPTDNKLNGSRAGSIKDTAEASSFGGRADSIGFVIKGTGRRENRMSPTKGTNNSFYKWVLPGLVVSALVVFAVLPAHSARGPKAETIEASAFGTGTQMGQVIGISVEIYEYSTPEDRQSLFEAFTKGQNQGLVNALSKMHAVGHISITGTLGYDLAFVRLIPTPTGRKIRFVTNRQIRFGEAWADAQSLNYNLTAGEFDLDAADKSKSTGVLYPECQLVIDKEGQLQIQLNQNAWKLNDVLDWPGTAGVN
jgi:hypothetical protein